MQNYFYDNCRIFLEKMISEKPDNNELIKAYTTLISKMAEVDIKYSEHNTDFNKTNSKNQADVTKSQHSTQAEITKKQIDKGPLPISNSPVLGGQTW